VRIWRVEGVRLDCVPGRTEGKMLCGCRGSEVCTL
jgi:hypothetical protein